MVRSSVADPDPDPPDPRVFGPLCKPATSKKKMNKYGITCTGITLPFALYVSYQRKLISDCTQWAVLRIRIRDSGWIKVGSGIRDKHPGSATLPVSNERSIERLDQGHHHPKLDVRDWHVFARNRTRASVVGGEHSSKELFEQRVNTCSEHLHMNLRHGSPQCRWLHKQWTSMNVHELGCRPNSTCKLSNPEYWHQAITSPCIHCQARQIITTMVRLDHGQIHPKLEVPRRPCLGRESNPGLHGAKIYLNSV